MKTTHSLSVRAVHTELSTSLDAGRANMYRSNPTEYIQKATVSVDSECNTMAMRQGRPGTHATLLLSTRLDSVAHWYIASISKTDIQCHLKS